MIGDASNPPVAGTIATTGLIFMHLGGHQQERNTILRYPLHMVAALIPISTGGLPVPSLFAPSDQAGMRFLEFFTVHIRNRNTRRAYYNAGRQFKPMVRSARTGRFAPSVAGTRGRVYRRAAADAVAAIG